MLICLALAYLSYVRTIVHGGSLPMPEDAEMIFTLDVSPNHNT
jgi:hypothetical protein